MEPIWLRVGSVVRATFPDNSQPLAKVRGAQSCPFQFPTHASIPACARTICLIGCCRISQSLNGEIVGVQLLIPLAA